MITGVKTRNIELTCFLHGTLQMSLPLLAALCCLLYTWGMGKRGRCEGASHLLQRQPCGFL